MNVMNLKHYDHVVGSLASEFVKTGLEAGHYFPWSIVRMNQMYALPINSYPTLDGLRLSNGKPEKAIDRLTKFLGVLSDEISEGQEIRYMMQLLNGLSSELDIDDEDQPIPTESELVNGIAAFGVGTTEDKRVKDLARTIHTVMMNPEWGDTPNGRLERLILVSLGDWFGDMVVYIRSEALKFGLPLESILAVIMGSNFTKLDENKKPIKDEATGKVLKGPNFMAPERHIYATMFEADTLLGEYQDRLDEQTRLDAVSSEVLSDPMAAVLEADAQAQEEDVEYDEDDADDETFALPG